MASDSDFIKTIFGLKMKQFRQKKSFSLQDLATITGVSKSYLNEIENGKKYPKHDKIAQLATALNCSYDDLVSTKLDKSLAPITEILQSDFFKENEMKSLSEINPDSIIHKLSHQHLHIKFWKVHLKGNIENGITSKVLKALPFPIVIHNFIEKEMA